MRRNGWNWVVMAVLAASPVFAADRTGILAPHAVRMEQEEILKALREGNRWHAAHHKLKSGLPNVMVVSCADSRVPPETVFNMKPGELYTNRAFGGIVDKVILGSLEYGADKMGCRVLVVLGHTRCTAIKEAIEAREHPDVQWRSMNLQALTAKLLPVLSEVDKENRERWAREGRGLAGDDLEEEVIKANVLNTMRTIRQESPVLWKLEQQDLLRIVGGVYDLDTGRVAWIKE